MSRRNVLNEMVASRKLSVTGRDWLTLALDPFHDYNHQIAGYPDADGSQTVVACYEYQAQIAAPAGAVANWDAHVVTTPLAVAESLYEGTLNAGWTTFARTMDARQTLAGPLTIYSNAAGGALVPIAAAGSPTSLALPLGAQATDLAFGMTRVIGMGFEIHNTTSEMYKQGSLTAYRMPNQPTDEQLTVSNFDGSTVATYNAKLFRTPPANPQEALALKGSVSWSAADGCYAVPTLSSVVNPIRNYGTIGYIASGNAAGTAGVAQAGSWVTVAANAAPAATLITPQLRKFTNFDTTGVFLTGLSNQSTFKVVLKVYVERAPTQTESSLAVVATPSAPYDLAALELYSHCVSSLPVAAKVGENAKGDWWKSVLSVLSDLALPMSAVLNAYLPGAPLIGAALQGGAKLALGEFGKRPSNSNQAIKQAAEAAVKAANASNANSEFAVGQGKRKKKTTNAAQPSGKTSK